MRWRDEDALETIAAARDRYVETLREAEKRLRLPLLARLDAAFAWNPSSRRLDPRPGPELVSFHRERLAWLAALDMAEAELLRTLSGIPPAENGQTLGRVRWLLAAERDRRPLADPLASLPLEEVLQGMPEPEIRALLQGPELEVWRERMVAAMRTRRQALDELLLRRAQALEARGPFELPPDDPRRAIFERESAEIDAREASTEAPIAELNRATLARLRSQLPPSAADALTERVARLVQPQVFEEERSLVQFMEQLAGDPRLDPAAVETLGGLALHGQQRLASGRSQLLRLLELRDEADRGMLLDPTPASRRRLLLAEIQLIEAQLARRRVARQVVNGARGSMPPQAEQALALIQRQLDALAALERADQWRLESARWELLELDRPMRRPMQPVEMESVEAMEP